MYYLGSVQDQTLMENRIKETVQQNFEEHTEYIMSNPLLFGDFRNAMSEGEQRNYEDLLDYDAVYYLFQEVGWLVAVLHCFINEILPT